MYRLPRAFRLRQQHLGPPRTNRKPIQRRLEHTMINGKGQPVRYQAVRFKKPGLTMRRIATIGLYGGAVYAYLSLMGKYLDIEIEMLDDMEVEEDKQGEEEEDEEDDGPIYADENSIFIPMTWAQQQPRTFYKGSDPEWQEFIKIAKDKPRHKKIQDELVQTVFSGSQQHPGISRQLGKDAKVGKYWLDISFPDGPPREYERSGIELGDGFIAWSQQRISPEQHWKLKRALWPKAAFDSCYATAKVLFNIQFRRLKQALYGESGDSFSPDDRLGQAMELLRKREAAKEGNTLSKAQMDPGTAPGAVAGSTSTADAAPARATSDGKKLPWTINVPMPPTAAVSSTDVPIAMAVFQTTLAKQWNPKKMEPPKGTFVVSGLIEVRGARGRMLFDVQGCYDPKAAKYTTVNAGVRNFKQWNQRPKGGQ